MHRREAMLSAQGLVAACESCLGLVKRETSGRCGRVNYIQTFLTSKMGTLKASLGAGAALGKQEVLNPGILADLSNSMEAEPQLHYYVLLLFTALFASRL